MNFAPAGAGIVAIFATISPANAALVNFQNYTGAFGVSTDGASATTGVSTISASIPSGSTVTAAYLYAATQDNFAVSGNVDPATFFNTPPPGVELNGVEVSFAASFPNLGTKAARNEINLSSHRADVTSIVSAAYNADTSLGVYDFDYAETVDDFHIDGSALVVVYENPALDTTTVSILNGAQSSDGDTFTLTFAEPLDLSDPDLVAEMILGINFSCCGQRSSIAVSGAPLTENAGNADDGGAIADGQLITVGGFDDPFSPLLPSYEADTERYDLSSLLPSGATSVNIFTENPTDDDNIFLAVLRLSGEVDVDGGENPIPPIPLPASVVFLVSALGALRFGARRSA